MDVEKILRNLEREIKETQKGLQQAESLERVYKISKDYRGDDEVISFETIAEGLRNEKPEEKIMSGWKGLDDILKGFRVEQLVVISALTKSGKTSFLMDLTTRLNDYSPLWFPFEESAKDLIRKFIERDEPIPYAFSPAMFKLNPHLTGGIIEWIECRILESIAKYGTKVIFIDQLDFLIPYNADSRADRIGQVMRELKSIAKKWGVLIFLICHLIKTKMDTQPTLEDLKGSSSIGQEADTVILLWRETKREHKQVVITNNVNVSVQANRREGTTGNVKMVYNNGKFLEEDWRTDEEAADEEFDKF